MNLKKDCNYICDLKVAHTYCYCDVRRFVDVLAVRSLVTGRGKICSARYANPVAVQLSAHCERASTSDGYSAQRPMKTAIRKC
jgi:hypothetical protein